MSFLDTVKGLSLQKKIIAGAAVGAVGLAMVLLTQQATKPPMALLYAGVDTGAAAEIVAILDKEGVEYSLEGERIYVEAPERDRLRLTLAGEGLPRQGIAGYELLDSLSGFSTTSDMFDAAYWRAKEGELTRTILAMPGVRAARVHIGADDRNPFTRGEGRTASVTITAPAGLTPAQVKAIQHVTALAISDLRPDQVAVADTARGLLSQGAEGEDAALLDGDKREAALEAELTRLLEARVGPGNARVSVALEITREREAITEQSVDPTTQVVTNRTISEMRETETGQDRAVTIASDLPEGEGAAGDRQAERTESREEVAYAVTTRDRTYERLPGQVQRMSVAVLLNTLPPAEEGAPEEPRAPEEIAALRELVEAAAGVDAARGDRLTIQSLAFDRPEIELVEGSPLDVISGNEGRLWQAGQIAFLGLVALALGLFVVKPVLTQGGAGAAGTTLAGPNGSTLLLQDPVTMLRSASNEEPDMAAALLNAWLQEERPS